MSFNASDIQFYIIPETVEGVVPSTGTAHKLDHSPGSSPTYSREAIASPKQYAKRMSGGTRTVGGSVGGSLDFHLSRSDAIDLLLASALSGKWVGNSLVAGDQDTSFTILKTTGEGNDTYHAYKGVQVSELSISVDPQGNAEGSVNLIGMDYEKPTSFALPEDIMLGVGSTAFGLASPDVLATIGLLPDVKARSITITVGHEREVKDALGDTPVVGIGTSGSRTATIELTFYRKDFAPETVFENDARTPASILIGGGIPGYEFSGPAFSASWPEESVDGSKLLVTVTLTASYDVNGDFKITKTA